MYIFLNKVQEMDASFRDPYLLINHSFPKYLTPEKYHKGPHKYFCILDNCISSDFNTGYLIQRKIFCKLLLFVLLISYIFTYFTATTKINLQNNSYHCILIHAIFLFAEIISFVYSFLGYHVCRIQKYLVL